MSMIVSGSALGTLAAQYGPLCPDVCEWLQQVTVDVSNGSWCGNVSDAALPQDVCDALANQSAPLSACTRCLPRAPTLDRDDVIRAALLGMLALLSCVGNLYTIYSIRSKASPAVVYKLLLHLSVADVVVAVVCIAGEAIWMLLVQWPFGNVACKAFKFVQMTALHGSSYVVVLIAQNRWVAVSHPLATRRHSTSLPRSVLFVWAVGACLSTPQ
ncbi:gonadotropin-releasing hormone receptor-like, partial [Frankliniella occidentalis]|uniref:Gonadotropin-releasing hormone receptor-like n=1 Tax=Frankliniella occidentalis TaxID=133901 RepID=A0A9C6X951_FRAOC